MILYERLQEVTMALLLVFAVNMSRSEAKKSKSSFERVEEKLENESSRLKAQCQLQRGSPLEAGFAVLKQQQ